MQAAARIAGGADYKGRVYMFGWPSVSQSLRYLQDVDNAEEAEGSLQAFLAAILRDNNIRTLDIVAHSMGSQQLMRVMGSIRSILDGRRHEEGSLHLGQVVFAAPDVSAAVFNTKIRTVGQARPARDDLHVGRRLGAVAVLVPARPQRPRRRAHAVGRAAARQREQRLRHRQDAAASTTSGNSSRYSHADYVDDKVILNDIQTVITGKPAGDPSKRDPEGEVFKVMPYKGMTDRKYWATLPEARDQMQRPPSTSSATPVMNGDAGSARNSAALAMSCGCDRRPSGMPARNLARFSGVSGSAHELRRACPSRPSPD